MVWIKGLFGKPGLVADCGQDGAQIHVAQVQRQRLAQDRGQIATEQHLLDGVHTGTALDVANKKPL